MPDEFSQFCRYLHLAWAKYELYQGKKNNARLLLERGHLFNPKDAAILQAGTLLPDKSYVRLTSATPGL